MTTGPTRWQSTTVAPGSTTTGPSTTVSASTDPSTRCSSVSNTRRLDSRSGSFFPVSSHQPVNSSWWTVCPASMSQPMASVISSSPRSDGTIAATASWTAGVNR